MWQLEFSDIGYEKFLTNKWLFEFGTVGSWQSVLALGTFVRAAASRSRERRRAHFVHVSASELKAVLAESLCDPEWEACARAKKLSEKATLSGARVHAAFLHMGLACGLRTQYMLCGMTAAAHRLEGKNGELAE